MVTFLVTFGPDFKVTVLPYLTIRGSRFTA